MIIKHPKCWVCFSFINNIIWLCRLQYKKQRRKKSRRILTYEDWQIEAALCKRLESIRLARNITQVQLADEAGVSPRTIGRLEKGQGVSMDTFIRIMMALRIQQNLKALLPDPTVRPIERVGIGAGERKRARPIQPNDKHPTWSWGDSGVDDE